MCTLVVLKNVFPGYPLVVVANRDEQFSRPAEVPTVKEAPHKILSPTDLGRPDRPGGTWIGVNEYGVFVALTNRKSIPSVRGLLSRGELVSDALKQRTALQALATVMNREPGRHNACHLVIADSREGFTIVGNGVGGSDVDGHDITPGFTYGPLNDGLNIVTNLGMGVGCPRGNAIERSWDQIRVRGLPAPRPSSFAPMLTWHDREKPSEGFHGRRYDGICLHPHDGDPDYGTVSSSVTRLSTVPGRPSVWHYWHGARKKTSMTFCETKWSDMMTLPIRTE